MFPDELDSARNRFDPTLERFTIIKRVNVWSLARYTLLFIAASISMSRLVKTNISKKKDGNFIELKITVKCCAQTRETNKKEKESTTTTTAAAESSGAERYGLTVLGQEQMTLMMIYNLLLPARLRHLFPSFSLQRQRTRYLHMANN